MSEEKIKKTEVDLLSTAIDRIVSSEVLQSVMSDQLPLTSNLTDSNKIYRGKASILFVDMRDSTKLPERFNAAQLVRNISKLYSYCCAGNSLLWWRCERFHG